MNTPVEQMRNCSQRGRADRLKQRIRTVGELGDADSGEMFRSISTDE